MRAICLEKRWQHHAKSSGYDRLADFIDARRISRVQIESLPARAIAKVWERLSGEPEKLFDYQLGDRLAEEQAFWLSWMTRAQIIHVFYGDEQLNLLLKRKALQPAQLVATFHLPSERTRERFERTQKSELARLSGAIVVASHELATFQSWLGPDKVMYVPHGIDTEAYSMGPGNASAKLRLLFVGLHMRDFEVAHRVADRCARDGLAVVFDVVLPANRFSFFTGCDNVQRHSGLSDAALVELYRNADALFLPVTGATANNAVLEALACGTPVISTHIGGIPDYVDESSGWLLPPADADAAFECVRNLVRNREIAPSMRAGARRKSEEFAWTKVAKQITEGYQRIVRGGSFAG